MRRLKYGGLLKGMNMRQFIVRIQGHTASGKTRFINELRERLSDLYHISEDWKQNSTEEVVVLTRKEGE